ncbi:MAG TPA: response regulator [Polyangiaceae bacterium]
MSRNDRGSCPDSEEARPRMPRLLVVDDELLLVEAIEVALGERVDVLATADPHEALASIDTGERYDAILLDVRMPEMDGIELCERIAAISPSQARRVVFMTAATSEADGRLSALPNTTLRKPLDLSRVDELLSSWLPGDTRSARIKIA